MAPEGVEGVWAILGSGRPFSGSAPFLVAYTGWERAFWGHGGMGVQWVTISVPH